MAFYAEMTLDEYLKSTGQSQVQFAQLIGKDQSTVQRYVRGQRIPGPETMVLIAKVTDGTVLPNDFYPDATADTPESDPANSPAAADDAADGPSDGGGHPCPQNTFRSSAHD